MEGGSITTDGEGTLIATEACFLSKGRNPNLSKAEIEETLKVYLGVNDIIWIPHGIIGDETDEHVDNMVAFSRPGEVLLAWPSTSDKIQYNAATKALKILESTKDAHGRPIKVIKVKMPNPIYLTNKEAKGIYSASRYGAKPRKGGSNLLATYINFYQSDRFVIVPGFGVKEDAIALKQFKTIFPEKEVIQISSKEILIGGGNIHCVTMQVPKGVKHES
jgi:agmatine deiminase